MFAFYMLICKRECLNAVQLLVFRHMKCVAFVFVGHPIFV